MKPTDESRLLKDVVARQRNTVWPDTVRNGALVDSFLWRGSASATLVQRVGIAFFGALFLCSALMFVRFALLEFVAVRVVLFLFAGSCGAIGSRLLRNAFRH